MDHLAWNKNPARPLGAPRPGFGARLRPHELIAMLTHHYARARARRGPPVVTRLHVLDPRGRQAVVIDQP